MTTFKCHFYYKRLSLNHIGCCCPPQTPPTPIPPLYKEAPHSFAHLHYNSRPLMMEPTAVSETSLVQFAHRGKKKPKNNNPATLPEGLPQSIQISCHGVNAREIAVRFPFMLIFLSSLQSRRPALVPMQPPMQWSQCLTQINTECSPTCTAEMSWRTQGQLQLRDMYQAHSPKAATETISCNTPLF